MNYTTITIGGSNKNFFFSKVCLEFLILNCLKNKNVKKHIHIGRIPKFRIMFLRLILLSNGINKCKFVYMNQVKSLDLLSNYQGSIVISSAPIIGSLTILHCWKFRLPVLVYDPQIYCLNFPTFLKNEELVWKNFNELFYKFDFLIKNYKKYSAEYYEHYLFLKENKTLANNFLLDNAKRKYYNFNKRNSIYCNLNLFTIIYTLLSKSAYLIIKICFLLFYIYLKPLHKNIIKSVSKFLKINSRNK
tara:strand:+ start:3726 stop:4463 length:738 start_codon:yes stop_codon:yes gene_type:complete